MKKDVGLIALFLTSAIWGFAFVAQRQGMETLDPFVFNGIRFSLGAIIVGLFGYKTIALFKKIPWSLGIVLFAAATLQQTGLIWTTAGNAGFITGLYVVFVPLLGLFRKQRITRTTFIAVLLAVCGLFLINDNRDLQISLANGVVLIAAVLWGVHLQLIDKLTKKQSTLYLAFYQFTICAVLSFLFGLLYNLIFRSDVFQNGILIKNIGHAATALLYSGLISVGIAYTLQVFAQKKVEPAKSALILCLESVFALLGGWWLLREEITPAVIAGASLLLTAMLISIVGRVGVARVIKPRSVR